MTRAPAAFAAGLIPAHAGKTQFVGHLSHGVGAHPRSRGENGTRPCCAAARWGSSPLTRGKLSVARMSGRPSGLIPAHAGKTASAAWAAVIGWAHPRSRGENLFMAIRCIWLPGSSPLTRGKRVWPSAGWKDRGLIPAHAGKTPTARQSPPCSRAHPRSRGENHPASGHTRTSTGSSPLTRGKRYCRRSEHHARGLIPAHAGKTSSRSHATSKRRAHPRSRGENRWERRRGCRCWGSSPLTRGKRDKELLHGLASSAHPRSRGENRQRVEGADATNGSSPLTRGKPRRRILRVRLRGLIPAHAGKTSRPRLRSRRRRAHPRSRGENYARFGCWL